MIGAQLKSSGAYWGLSCLGTKWLRMANEYHLSSKGIKRSHYAQMGSLDAKRLIILKGRIGLKRTQFSQIGSKKLIRLVVLKRGHMHRGSMKIFDG